ncbi:5-amino-6-uracil reductase-like protein [Westerdykella ornata]|uniref:2,5-diamino-6-ribosylamino-4(3H)-pyrimidinone 5'-phosphate reductase n=1 Tax=Westerdykella ornata TaxID=318751 RepID=A0A6A6JKZ3_WESOR|nr:5-amino-6-uracil reductase-like protein [Westerdykella ornata]KAF2276905.1 5-amino-6-uracil reductase-like protein [Westerdykella ornata]
MASSTREVLHFPATQSKLIDPYLPFPSKNEKPYVTLTFATSLDSNLSLAPGVQTHLSGPESKAMTHYLRSQHDAILIGVGTAVADDPSLNCRIEGAGGYGGEGLTGQPRPIVLDPRGRWEINEKTKCIALAREKKGKAPWLVMCQPCKKEVRDLLESVGGQVLVVEPVVDDKPSRIPWHKLVETLAGEGIQSIMIEGGGSVINDLLSPQYFGLVDSVIVTIAPTWLGKGGVQVCPEERIEGETRVPVARLKGVKWVPLGEDVVLCGRPIVSPT